MKRITSIKTNVPVTQRAIRWVILALLAAGSLISATTMRAATAATYQFTLAWSNPDTSVTANLIESSPDGTNFTQIAQLDPTLTSYTDSGLAGATVYYFRMRSQNAAGDSAYSAVVSGLTPPELSIDSPADGQVVNTATTVLSGTAMGVNGIASVTVNGQAVSLTASNWSATVALASGANTFTVIVTDNHSYTATATVNIIYDAPPVANFSATPTVGSAPLTVNFNNQASGIVTNYLWDFGDGFTSTLANPSHSYALPGSYAVSLSVVGPGGANTASLAGFITVTNTLNDISPPTLTIVTPTDYQTVPTTTVTVSGTALDASGVQSVTVNGVAATLNGTAWSATVALSAGMNTLTVIATDNSPNHNAVTQAVHASYIAAPAPSFTATPVRGPAPLNVTFTDTAIGIVTNIFWNFGDGTTSMVSSPTHTYATPGSYAVTFIASGPGGAATLNYPAYITVTSNGVVNTTPPTLAITTPTDYQVVGNSSLTVAGTASDASGLQSVTVNGQAATLSGNNWSATITLSNGTNTLTVIATDSNQNSTTQTVHAVLAAAPVANFTGTPTVGAAPLLVTFTDASTGTIATRSWNFGDGGTSALVNPTHSYANSGTYSVSLTVSGVLGAVTFNRASFITITNVAANTTAPTLKITTLTDYQLVGSSLTIGGTASDPNGIQSVTVNSQPATLNGNNWSETMTVANGTNTLVVIATDNSPNQNATTQTIHAVVGAVPVANFTGTPTTGAAPLLVTFTDASTGTIATRSWNFGDGGTSALVNPTHSYANSGTYSVSLTVSGALGAVTFNRASFITVTNVASAGITAPTLAITTPTDYQLVGSSSLTVAGTASDASGIQSVTVNGQAATLSGNNWSAPFTLSAGTNTFTVIATDSSANQNTTTQIVHVVLGAPPAAYYTATPTNGATPLLVTFTDASSGTIATRSWSFGDGSTSTSVNPTHSYANVGNYSVSLTVSSALGSITFNRFNYITVTNVVADTTPPTLTIATPTDYQITTSSGLTVAGTASDASGVQSVTVNGQAATLNGNNWSASVTLGAGTNTFTIIATDSSANQNTTTQIVHTVLIVAPSANFTGTPTTGAAPLLVNFNDTSTGVVTNRVWNFGDGSNSTLVNPTHSYASVGTYAVTLTVTGPGGPSVLSRGSFVTVTNTVTGTGPALAVSSPVDYQVFSNASINITGTASDASGVQSVTVNGQTATLNGTGWNAPLTLAAGTNTFTVVATDASPAANTSTLIIHAVMSLPTGPALTNDLPQIVVAPAVTNAMSQVGNVNVVVAGEPVGFTVQAVDPLGGTLTYEWSFGDNQTDPDESPEHTYASTNCQGYAVQVIISNAAGSTTGAVQVATACSLNVEKLELYSNLTATNTDHYTVTATVELNSSFSTANQTIALDIGGAQVSFQMNSKGVGTGTDGKTQLTYNKKTALWTLTASLKNGDWHNQWLDYGLVTGQPLTGSAAAAVPAVVVVGTEAFAAQPTVASVATVTKNGLAHVTSRSGH